MLSAARDYLDQIQLPPTRNVRLVICIILITRGGMRGTLSCYSNCDAGAA